MIRIIVWVMTIPFGFAACANPPLLPGRELVSAAESVVVLGPGDLIDVKFRYWPELDESQTIRPDGKITLQIVDEVEAVGLTPVQLGQKLTELYASKLKDPIITIIVRSLASQRVFVGGEVARPGIIPLQGKMTVLDAIIAAGGHNKLGARLDNVLVLRQQGEKRLAVAIDVKNELEQPSQEPFFLAANDVVFVSRTQIDEINQVVEQYFSQLLGQTGATILHRVDSRTTVGISP